jgi:uncharacterized protein YqeY
MSASALKVRLRADLKDAMKERRSDDARLLRTLIAAIDNAEAVPVDLSGAAHASRTLGDPSGEVARLELDDVALGTILAAEQEARRAAAEDYDRHGRTDEAARLRAEAAQIERYAG